jgi:excisionase family DNA binding protein
MTAKEKRLASVSDIKLFTLTELEEVLGVTHRTLLTYIKNGILKGVKVGGKWKVTEENLRKFISGEK